MLRVTRKQSVRPFAENSGQKAYPSSETCRSPDASWIHTPRFCWPTEVMSERPSAATASPSSSVVPPAVTCSGSPSGKRCRHTWNPSPVSAVKYIHRPSGAHAALVQRPGAGPTRRPDEPPAHGISRHGVNTPPSSISTMSTHCPSGERDDRCAIASTGGQESTAREGLRGCLPM